MANLLIAIFNMSIAGSAVIIFALMVRFFLRRFPKKYTYILWGIVSLRLICPFGISFPALLNLMQGKKTGPFITLTEYIPQTFGQVLSHASGPVGIVAYLLTFFFAFWLVGFVGMLIYESLAYYNARKRLATAIRVQDQVFETDQVSTPFIFGLINPKIYVPAGLGKNELHYVLCHESIHIKRKDYLIKFLACFVLAFHWFNPFVWLAFKYMSIDMEMSCDEKVVATLGNHLRKEYAEMILHLSQTKIKVTKSMLTFGASDTRIRVSNLLNKKQPTAIGTAGSVIICAFLLMGLVSNSAVSSTFSFMHTYAYEREVSYLASTDLSSVAVDGMHIGSSITDVDLSAYPSDRPNTTGDYDYFFNEIRIGLDGENNITAIFAEASFLEINSNTEIVTIEDITDLLGENYLDKMEDSEQRLRKHVYFDHRVGVMAEFTYAEYDGTFLWVVLRELN